MQRTTMGGKTERRRERKHLSLRMPSLVGMKFHAFPVLLEQARARFTYPNHHGSWPSQQVQHGAIKGDSPGTHRVSDDIIAMNSFNYQIFSYETCVYLNCLIYRRDRSVTLLNAM